MKNKLASYRNGTKIRSVTNAPDWIIRLRGRMDSRKGESVAKAHVDFFLDRCTELEALECLSAEELLYDTRKDGADALAIIQASKEKLENFPGPVAENGPMDIRENARRRAEKSAAETALVEARQRMFAINETITNGDAVLHERVIKTRKKASWIIDAYVKGLRGGGLKSFEAALDFSEKAVEEYHSRHQKTDDAIRRVATSIMGGDLA